MEIRKRYISCAIVAVLIFPIFFQLSGNIFNDPSLVFDSMGNPMRVPIPFSVFACFGGLLFFKNFKRSNLALYMLFFFLITMLVTTIISTKDNQSALRSKFILLIQFVLPMFSLALGQIYGLYESDSKIFEKTAAWVLSILIPVQLLSTWYAGTTVLSPYIYFFSIYQQLQYVPTILICLYLYTIYSLWQHYLYRKALIVLAPLVGVYVILSGSILTAIVLISGLFLFTYLSWKQASDKTPAFILFAVVCVSGMSIILLEGVRVYEKDLINKYDVNLSNRVIIANKLRNVRVTHLSNRYQIWYYHLSQITTNPKIFFFGNPVKPDRGKYPSAHNYFLDLVYNFGIFPLIPIAWLILFTIKKVVNIGKNLFEQTGLLGLVFIISFLVIIDNSFKVGLRQPYPGIITFFLWGLLLARLSPMRSSVPIHDEQ